MGFKPLRQVYVCVWHFPFVQNVQRIREISRGHVLTTLCRDFEGIVSTLSTTVMGYHSSWDLLYLFGAIILCVSVIHAHAPG